MKSKKIWIILGIIVLIIIFLILIFHKTDHFEDKLRKTIIDQGFVLDTGTLYKKDNAEYPLDLCNIDYDKECIGEELYFDIASYDFYKIHRIISSEVIIDFTLLYKYKYQSLEYNYHVNYLNGVLILSGEYNAQNDNYTCNLDYHHGIDLSDGYNDLCEELKSEIDDFYYESLKFITDSYLLDHMKS